MSHVIIPTEYLDSLIAGKKLMRRELRTFLAVWSCLSAAKEVRPIQERQMRKAMRIRMQPVELRRAVNRLIRLNAIPSQASVEWE